MQTIKDLFNNYRIATPIKTRRTERGDLVTEFAERLNAERGERKPLTISGVAFLLSPFNVSDLYLLLKKCNEAKSFSACFWYFSKPNKK